MEFIKGDPSFGNTLLNDNFGKKPTDEHVKTKDSPQLDAVGKQDEGESTAKLGGAEKMSTDELSDQAMDPLLQASGATKMFDDMHGFPIGLDGEKDLFVQPPPSELRHMAGLTVGPQRLGNTDWGSGTDGGMTGKPQDGVIYGSFSGV